MSSEHQLNAFNMLFTAKKAEGDRDQWAPIVLTENEALVAVSYPNLEREHVIQMTKEYGKIISDLEPNSTYMLAVALKVSAVEASLAAPAIFEIVKMPELRESFSRGDIKKHLLLVSEKENMALLGAYLTNAVGISVDKFIGKDRKIEFINWLTVVSQLRKAKAINEFAKALSK